MMLPVILFVRIFVIFSILLYECSSLLQFDRLPPHEPLVASCEQVVWVCPHGSGQKLSTTCHIAVSAREESAEVGQGLGVVWVDLNGVRVVLYGCGCISIDTLRNYPQRKPGECVVVAVVVLVM